MGEWVQEFRTVRCYGVGRRQRRDRQLQCHRRLRRHVQVLDRGIGAGGVQRRRRLFVGTGVEPEFHDFLPARSYDQGGAVLSTEQSRYRMAESGALTRTSIDVQFSSTSTLHLVFART